MTEFEKLAARVAQLEAELGRLRGRAGGQLRAANAQHMDAASWQRIYGSGGRPLGEVAAEAQLAARGTVWGSGDPGPTVVYGPEPAGWR